MPAERPPQFATFDVRTQEEALRHLVRLVAEDTLKPIVKRIALQIVRRCKARNDECELAALFAAVKDGDPDVPGLEDGMKYVSDPFFVDYYSSPAQLLAECLHHGACGSDCLPVDTLVLTAGHKLTPIGDVREGDLVMGDGEWARVLATQDKGIQPLLSLRLSNKNVLRCTPDHRLFRVLKRGGYTGVRSGVEEVRASEVRPDDDLLTIERIPFGTENIGDDRAKLLGLYIADGWDARGRNGDVSHVSISGKDGHRKQAQKEWVRNFCAGIGVATRWDERYISIKDRPLSVWLAAGGHLAINKHVPSMNLTESNIRALLEGLAADADIRNGCYGTISPLLAVQLRVLFRMLGRKTSIKLVKDHGGLGKHPIYRVQPWSGNPEDLRARGEFARVRSVEPDGEGPTCDITVDGGRFYLPETDLVVHNCDDQAALMAALAGSLGFRVGIRAWGPEEGRKEYVHVYAVALVPKDEPDENKCQEYGLDTSADVGDSHAGWQPEPGEVVTAWLTERDYQHPTKRSA